MIMISSSKSPSWKHFLAGFLTLSHLSHSVLGSSDGSGLDEFGLGGVSDEIWNPKGICPSYQFYSMYPHAPTSKGPLKVPFQRPAKRCRTFESAAVEVVINDIRSHFADLDLVQLFENAYPNTLDTTIRWHIPTSEGLASTSTDEREGIKQQTKLDSDKGGPSVEELDRGNSVWNAPQTFVVTGDIDAEWLRDSTNQLAGYQSLAKYDQPLAELIHGAISTQAEFVIRSPYCNAFQPPLASTLKPSNNGQQDHVNPVYEPRFVFECKWEIDSLAAFFSLGNQFYQSTGSIDFLSARWFLAADTVMQVLTEQSESTFDGDTGKWKQNIYRFRRQTDAGTETLALSGAGHPLNSGTGLVRSAFRPSDDSTIFGFFVPGNAMMAVELNRTATFLEHLVSLVGGEESESAATLIRRTGRSAQNIRDLAAEMKSQSGSMTAGIWNHGVVQHSVHGPVFAFEVDGYGSRLLMDDANVPSLLSLPILGFVPTEYDFPIDVHGNPILPKAGTEADAERIRPVGKYYNSVDAARVYANTRRMVLHRQTNPYFLVGPEFSGIGGPHVGPRSAWPMSLLVEILTAPRVPQDDGSSGKVQKRDTAVETKTESAPAQESSKESSRESLSPSSPPFKYSDPQNQLHICHPLTFAHLHTILILHAKLGLIHETVQVDDADAYTRPWFAWANAVFSQVVLRVAEECGSDVIDRLKDKGIGGFGKGGAIGGDDGGVAGKWLGIGEGAGTKGLRMLRPGKNGYGLDESMRKSVKAENEGGRE